MTLLKALRILNALPFNGPEQTAIWTRAYAIEDEGTASDHSALILAIREFAATREVNAG